VRRVVARAAEIGVLALVAGFLYLALSGEHPVSTPIREYLVEFGSSLTGAPNVVTAIYLGFRAFDTLGETVVLLLAVAGVAVFVERRR
jgi:multicomponent Na+:H+ antiporter subunit B